MKAGVTGVVMMVPDPVSPAASADISKERVAVRSSFAWEYLRRHEDYHRDFETICSVKQPAATQLDAFTQRWGLRFPMRSRNPA
jgi:hypothetical protein